MYTPLGPTYGTIPGPGGDLLVSPDDAKRLGFEPPSFTPPDSPVPDGALAMPPPDPMGAAPMLAPTAPVSLAPTPADQPAAPAPGGFPVRRCAFLAHDPGRGAGLALGGGPPAPAA